MEKEEGQGYRSLGTNSENGRSITIHNIPEVGIYRTGTLFSSRKGSITNSRATCIRPNSFDKGARETSDISPFISISPTDCSRASVVHLIQHEDSNLMNRCSSSVALQLLSPQQLQQMFFCWYVDGRSVESVECSIEDLCVALDPSTIASRLSSREIAILIRRYCEQQRVRERCCVFVLVGASKDVSLYFIKNYCSSWGSHIILLPANVYNKVFSHNDLLSSLKDTVTNVLVDKLSPTVFYEVETGVEGSTLETSRLLCERELIPQYITNIMGIDSVDRRRNRNEYIDSIKNIWTDRSPMKLGLKRGIKEVLRHRRVKIMKVLIGSPNDIDNIKQGISKDLCDERNFGDEKCDQYEKYENNRMKQISKSDLLVDFDKIWFLKAAREVEYSPLYVRMLAFILLEKQYDSCELYLAYDNARKAGVGRTPTGTILRLLETVVTPTDVMALRLMAVVPSHIPKVLLMAEGITLDTDIHGDDGVPPEGFPNIRVLCNRLGLTSCAHQGNDTMLSSIYLSSSFASDKLRTQERFSDTIWIDSSFQVEYRKELTTEEVTQAFRSYFARIMSLDNIYPTTYYDEYIALHDSLMREDKSKMTGVCEPNEETVTVVRESANVDNSTSRQIDECSWKRWKKTIKTHFCNEVTVCKIPISEIGVAYPPENCRSFDNITAPPLLPQEDSCLTPVLCCLYRFYGNVLVRRGEPFTAAVALERSLAILLYHFGQLYNTLEGDEEDVAPQLREKSPICMANSHVRINGHIPQSNESSGGILLLSHIGSSKLQNAFLHPNQTKTTFREYDDRSFLYALILLLIEKTYINLVYCYVAANKIWLAVIFLHKASSILVLLNGGRRDTPARATEILQRNLLLEVLTEQDWKDGMFAKLCCEGLVAASIENETVAEIFSSGVSDRTLIHKAKVDADEALSVLMTGTDMRLIGDLLCYSHRIISISHTYNKEDKLAADHAALAFQAYIDYIRDDKNSGSAFEFPLGICFSHGISSFVDHTLLMTTVGGKRERVFPFVAGTLPSFSHRQRELQWVRSKMGIFFSAMQSRRYTLVNDFLDRSIIFTRCGMISSVPDVFVVCGGSPLSDELARSVVPWPTYHEHLHLYVACTDLEVARHHGQDWMMSPVAYVLPAHTLLRTMTKGDPVAMKLFVRLLETNIDPNSCSPHDMKTLLHVAIECELTEVVLRLLNHPEVCPSFSSPYVLSSSRKGLSTVANIERVTIRTPSPLEMCKDNLDLMMSLILYSHKGAVQIFMRNIKFLVECFARAENGNIYLSTFFEDDENKINENSAKGQVTAECRYDEVAAVTHKHHDDKDISDDTKLLNNFKQRGIFSCLIPALIKGTPLCWLEDCNTQYCVNGCDESVPIELKEYFDPKGTAIAVDGLQKKTIIQLNRESREKLTAFCKERDIMSCALHCLDDPFIITGIVRRYKACVERTTSNGVNATVITRATGSVFPLSRCRSEASSCNSSYTNKADCLAYQTQVMTSSPHCSSINDTGSEYPATSSTYHTFGTVFRNNMIKLLTACIRKGMYATAAAVLAEVPDDILNVNMLNYDDASDYRRSVANEYQIKMTKKYE